MLSFVEQAWFFLFPKLQELRLSKAMTFSGLILDRSTSLQTLCFTTSNCGYPSDEFNQNDTSPDKGCSNANNLIGCHQHSSAFGFLTQINHFFRGTQGTNNCGRRHHLYDYRGINANLTVLGRLLNWLGDIDGLASGLGEPVIMGSGQPKAGLLVACWE